MVKRGGWIRCAQCHWESPRQQLQPGCVQLCSCGHTVQRSNKVPYWTPRQSSDNKRHSRQPQTKGSPPRNARPDNSAHANGKGGNGARPPHVNRWNSTAPLAHQLQSDAGASAKGATASPPVTPPEASGVRQQHTFLIRKYQGILDDLIDGDKDSSDLAEVKASLESKIQLSKAAIMADRPLASQVASLESYLDRKLAKILECQRDIHTLYDTLLATQQDVAEKRTVLEQLKQQQIAAIDAAPPPAQAVNATVEIANLKSLLHQVASAISSIEQVPTQTKLQLERLLQPVLSAPAVATPLMASTLTLPTADAGASALPGTTPLEVSPASAEPIQARFTDCRSAFGPASLKSSDSTYDPYDSRTILGKIQLQQESVRY